MVSSFVSDGADPVTMSHIFFPHSNECPGCSHCHLQVLQVLGLPRDLVKISRAFQWSSQSVYTPQYRYNKNALSWVTLTLVYQLNELGYSHFYCCQLRKAQSFSYQCQRCSLYLCVA
jgi:hypothetical protein